MAGCACGEGGAGVVAVCGWAIGRVGNCMMQPFSISNPERQSHRNRESIFIKPTCLQGCHTKKPDDVWSGWESGGGEDEDRTHDLLIANQALSQLSYPPTWSEV